LVQQKLSKQIMTDNKSNLQTVEKSIHDLESAAKVFEWFLYSTEVDKLKAEFKCDFKMEARFCQDLVTQSAYHLTRAKKLDEVEKELKRKQEMEIQQLKLKHEQEMKQKEQEVELQKLALIEKRAEFVKKTQNLTQNVHIETEKKTAKKVLNYFHFFK
jgi:hypothetical protein